MKLLIPYLLKKRKKSPNLIKRKTFSRQISWQYFLHYKYLEKPRNYSPKKSKKNLKVIFGNFELYLGLEMDYFSRNKSSFSHLLKFL